jgi:hypothetical protein
MLASNHEMMDLFEHLGPVRIVGRAGGTIEIEVAIPPSAAAPRPARDGRHDDRSVSAGEQRQRAAVAATARSNVEAETVDCIRAGTITQSE